MGHSYFELKEYLLEIVDIEKFKAIFSSQPNIIKSVLISLFGFKLPFDGTILLSNFHNNPNITLTIHL